MKMRSISPPHLLPLLWATFIIEFPVDEFNDNPIFYTTKSAITHKEKKELVVKIVNLHKLFELAKPSQT